MSATGSMWIGTLGAVVFLMGVFAFSQGNWKGGVRWDKPILMVWP